MGLKVPNIADVFRVFCRDFGFAMNIARTAVLALAVLSVTAAGPRVPRHFRSVGRPSPGLTQPKSLSLTKIKHYWAVRSNKQPHRIGRIATRAWPNSSLRLLLRNKGLTGGA